MVTRVPVRSYEYEYYTSTVQYYIIRKKKTFLHPGWGSSPVNIRRILVLVQYSSSASPSEFPSQNQKLGFPSLAFIGPSTAPSLILLTWVLYTSPRTVLDADPSHTVYSTCPVHPLFYFLLLPIQPPPHPAGFAS
ncbi:unnamed protein product [Tuber aestivum]|uniref:Uncharacterized protein n=1 Tax=Tuber aestivum TaxID=59557 RepID=A0A292PP10_9PEZI|nr:unnamed protein product [Tuber aestivum]